MNYTKNEIDNFNQKDKRISWLSIFSSLTQAYKDKKNLEEMGALAEVAFELTDELFEKYPIIEETPKDEQPM